MMGISDWFKRLRAQDDAQDVELAEEKARHEGVPAGDLPADQGSVDQDLRRNIDEVQRSGHIPMP
jgi:hypothetical protein